MKAEDLKRCIRDVPDFPKKGIIFKDLTTLLQDARAFKAAVNLMARRFRGQKIDQVIGIESRGFIFAAALAYKLGAGFVPVRKKGKLPSKTRRVTYQLEYGSDTLEIHADAVAPGSRVVIVDDLLATGGTMQAAVRLVRGLRARIVGVGFLVDLTFLKGKQKLRGLPVTSVIEY